MAEIGTTPPSVTEWPSTSAIHSTVHSTGDAKQSPKRQQKKHQQGNNTNVNKNFKKKPPDSGINSHIDEYA